MIAIRKYLRALVKDERGATAIEYGLIVALIAVAAIGALQTMGGGVNGKWGQVLANVSGNM